MDFRRTFRQLNKVYTQKQISALLGVSERTVRRLKNETGARSEQVLNRIKPVVSDKKLTRLRNLERIEERATKQVFGRAIKNLFVSRETQRVFKSQRRRQTRFEQPAFLPGIRELHKSLTRFANESFSARVTVKYLIPDGIRQWTSDNFSLIPGESDFIALVNDLVINQVSKAAQKYGIFDGLQVIGFDLIVEQPI